MTSLTVWTLRRGTLRLHTSEQTAPKLSKAIRARHEGMRCPLRELWPTRRPCTSLASPRHVNNGVKRNRLGWNKSAAKSPLWRQLGPHRWASGDVESQTSSARLQQFSTLGLNVRHSCVSLSESRTAPCGSLVHPKVRPPRSSPRAGRQRRTLLQPCHPHLVRRHSNPSASARHRSTEHLPVQFRLHSRHRPLLPSTRLQSHHGSSSLALVMLQ